MYGLRYTLAVTEPVSWMADAGQAPDHRGRLGRQFGGLAEQIWPLVTASRLVPSRLISASRPAEEEADRPSTATIEATPIAIPSADSAARSLRAASPTLASRARSAGRSRAVAAAARLAARWSC